MNAIKFETTVDESVAGAMPKLRPMFGRRIEVIALAAEPATETGTSLDHFLAHHRLDRPAGVTPVTLADIESAIAQGAMGDDV